MKTSQGWRCVCGDYINMRMLRVRVYHYSGSHDRICDNIYNVAFV